MTIIFGTENMRKPYIQQNRFSNFKQKIPVQYLDAIAVLEEANIEYREQGKNVGQGWIGVNCPFCMDHSFHMGINIQSKSISCWKCGTTGNIIKFLQAVTGSFQESLQLAEKMIQHNRVLKSFEIKNISNSAQVNFPRNTKPFLLLEHKNFLKKERKFNPKYLEEKYNLHSTGPDSDLPNRIIVPVVHNYRLLTYTGISISENARIKYFHCPNEKSVLHIKKYLYNLNTVKKDVFVVEGIFDAWRFGDTACPLFGANATDEQIKILAGIQNVYLLLDGDNAGRKGALRIAHQLSAFTNTHIISLPEGQDPDSLPREEINKIKQSIKEYN